MSLDDIGRYPAMSGAPVLIPVRRELGLHAAELYTHTKSVWVDLTDKPIGWFGDGKK